MEGIFAFLGLLFVAILSFVAVVIWAFQRRKERESLYYNETIRKIAEMHGPQAMLDYMRETDKLKTRRVGNGLTLGGILAVFGGAALTFFLFNAVFIPSAVGGGGGHGFIYLVGLIPVLVGLGLLFYSLVLAPRKNAARLEKPRDPGLDP
jgi:Flp pilus assembly protein TadB